MKLASSTQLDEREITPMDTIDTISSALAESHVCSGSRQIGRWRRKSSGNLLSQILVQVRARAGKRASRRTLRELTDVQLLDIGITRGEATREVSKSFFWD
jgi:uncharacterized protein YjiS (DUF1127 family)